ncbi:VQ motif-containing protein 22 [Vigna umbellata]|uniref:VQ motif-containing protein 22 n=1 Tax=Vigna umbellata TaxID=87088 RepID=UPI001F5E39F5|nr:VQ motif-containing protein 22 [Vigna umbellata]
MSATDDDQGMQFDEQFVVDDLDPFIEGFMDSSICMSSSKSNSSHNNNRTSGGHNLTPKGCAFKAVRRRSRASKTTPVTLLKANTSNFRALVQQFTGCSTTTTMSLAIHKGPITLNFQQGSKQEITKVTTPMPHVSQPQQPLIMREQQSEYWLEHVKSSSELCVPSWDSWMDNGFGFDDDFSLHELTVNAISNDIQGLFVS